jgi:hypothetical protein
MAQCAPIAPPAADPRQEQQEAAPEHATGLLDLPGALLCQIWQQLELEDRKSLCCTARALRACEGGAMHHH